MNNGQERILKKYQCVVNFQGSIQIKVTEIHRPRKSILKSRWGKKNTFQGSFNHTQVPLKCSSSIVV